MVCNVRVADVAKSVLYVLNCSHSRDLAVLSRRLSRGPTDGIIGVFSLNCLPSQQPRDRPRRVENEKPDRQVNDGKMLPRDRRALCVPCVLQLRHETDERDGDACKSRTSPGRTPR